MENKFSQWVHAIQNLKHFPSRDEIRKTTNVRSSENHMQWCSGEDILGASKFMKTQKTDGRNPRAKQTEKFVSLFLLKFLPKFAFSYLTDHEKALL